MGTQKQVAAAALLFMWGSGIAILILFLWMLEVCGKGACSGHELAWAFPGCTVVMYVGITFVQDIRFRPLVGKTAMCLLVILFVHEQVILLTEPNVSWSRYRTLSLLYSTPVGTATGPCYVSQESDRILLVTNYSCSPMMEYLSVVNVPDEGTNLLIAPIATCEDNPSYIHVVCKLVGDGYSSIFARGLATGNYSYVARNSFFANTLLQACSWNVRSNQIMRLEYAFHNTFGERFLARNLTSQQLYYWLGPDPSQVVADINNIELNKVLQHRNVLIAWNAITVPLIIYLLMVVKNLEITVTDFYVNLLK